MSKTEKQGIQALRRFGVRWAPEVRDPRAARGQRHEHRGLLNLLVTALACGKTTLRAAEAFCEDVGSRAKRLLHIPQSVSDSTLYRLLAKQGLRGLRQTLTATVVYLWSLGALKNDLFRIGVMTFDGKGAWSSSDKELPTARESSSGFTGQTFWALGSLRAVLTSSSARPCVDQELLAAKEGEATVFRELFPRVCAAHGDKFRIVTGDAGLGAWENAELVTKSSKLYVWGLKGNQPTLLALAKERFKDAFTMPLAASTTERADGETIIRDLRVVDLAPGETDFPGATQLWCEWKRHHQDDGSKSLEERFFIVSIPPKMLSAHEKLSLIRLHWGIENGHNWAMDMALLEDDAKPCQASPQAIEVLLWLRLLAFLLLSVFRSHAPLKDKRPMSWARSMERLRDLFIGLPAAEALLAFIA